MKGDAQIISSFNRDLAKSGKDAYSDFCIGVTSNLDKSLEAHKVSRGSNWIESRRAKSLPEAKRVVEYFIKKGMRPVSMKINRELSKTVDNYQHGSTVYVYALGPSTIE